MTEQEQYIRDLMSEENAFEITNDSTADWAVEMVNAARAERDRLVSLADEKIKRLQEKKQLYFDNCESATSYLRGKLMEYFQTVKTQDTKTMKKYKLVSGTLILKHQQPEYIRDEPQMVEWAEREAPEYVRTIKTISWGDLKKNTQVVGDRVCLIDSGEVIPGVAVVEREDVFEVQV